MSRRRWLSGWQVATLSAAGAVGSVAVANWLTQVGRREPENALNGGEALYPWTEGSIHYTVRGRGEPMLLLHDLLPGSSSFEFRAVFDRLSARYRVFAPDLLGFGLSGRPSTHYTPELYVALIEDFLRQVVGATDQPAHVVASGRSAPFAVIACASRPQMFRSLTMIEPSRLSVSEPVGVRSPLMARLLRLSLRLPLIGESAYNVVVSRRGLRFALRRRLASGGAQVSDDVLDHYYAVAHQPGARFAPADTLIDDQGTTAAEAFAASTTPMLLLWGQRDPARPVSEARALRESRPGTELRIFASGALPHVETPDAFIRELLTWLGAAARV